MSRSPVAVAAAALVIAIVAALAGCNRSADGPVASTDAPPVEAPQAVEPPLALLAYVWSCDDGQTLRTKNLPRDNAISLELHQGARKLPRVASASGEQYSDDTLTFRSKGDTATLERSGGAPVQCRLDRYQSSLADARARGVRYRGTGNEPGWLAEIGSDGRLLWVTNYGQERHEFEAGAAERDAGRATEVYQGNRGAERLRITLVQETCADDMSGQAFDYRMTVEFGGRSYRGCAVALQ